MINLGLHGGLGLDFIINEIKLSAKPKDIVILSIEYFLDVDGVYALKKSAASYYPNAYNFYRHNYYTELRNFFYQEFARNVDNNIDHLRGPDVKTTIQSDTTAVYSRRSFNVNGDLIGHLNKPSLGKMDGKVKYEMKKWKKWKGVLLLNKFAEYAKASNFKVYFLFPNYPESEFNGNKKVILQYAANLKRKLTMPILNNPDDFVFADSLFFDTVYHLTKAGRERRTTLLIKILKENNIR